MKNKRKATEVCLSSTFMQKNRCKFCSSYLSETFVYMAGVRNKDCTIVNSLNRKTDYQFLAPENHYMLVFSAYTYIHNALSLRPTKSYNPKLHKNNCKKINYVDGIACHCGKSFFMFNQSASESQIEIKNRKAKGFFKKSK